MKRDSCSNPFRIHGIVEGDYFTDRINEIKTMTSALTEPGHKLLVHGPRRMGKSSALRAAIQKANRKKKCVACYADLSTASTIADMANHVLLAIGRTLGERWKDVLEDIRRIRVSVELKHDSVSGLMLPALSMSLREAAPIDQHQTLGNILETFNQRAKKQNLTLGLVLDEFQEISRLGGRDAEWDLRSRIQTHDDISYVFSGSHEHLIERMTDKNEAFYGLCDKLSFGPIEPGHLSRWIDKRMTGCGLPAKQIGAYCVQLAGPRTRDIIQLARKTFDYARGDTNVLQQHVDNALSEITEEESDLFYRRWQKATAHQQNVLRAIAANQGGLTTRDVLRRFSLGASGTVANTAAALMEEGLLTRRNAYTGQPVETASGYEFDNPFFKTWIIRKTLPDIGIYPEEE